jgi:hypothetical protein
MGTQICETCLSKVSRIAYLESARACHTPIQGGHTLCCCASHWKFKQTFQWQRRGFENHTWLGWVELLILTTSGENDDFKSSSNMILH